MSFRLDDKGNLSCDQCGTSTKYVLDTSGDVCPQLKKWFKHLEAEGWFFDASCVDENGASPLDILKRSHHLCPNCSK